MNVLKFYANVIRRPTVMTYTYCTTSKWHFYVKMAPV